MPIPKWNMFLNSYKIYFLLTLVSLCSILKDLGKEQKEKDLLIHFDHHRHSSCQLYQPGASVSLSTKLVHLYKAQCFFALVLCGGTESPLCCPTDLETLIAVLPSCSVSTSKSIGSFLPDLTQAESAWSVMNKNIQTSQRYAILFEKTASLGFVLNLYNSFLCNVCLVFLGHFLLCKRNIDWPHY